MNPCGILRVLSRPEKREWNDGNTVGAMVGIGACGDDDAVGKPVVDLVGELVEVAYVVVFGGGCELHFDCDDLAVTSFDDEVDLSHAVLGSKVRDARA